MKLCPSCEEEKPDSGFGKNLARDDGLMPYCRVCVNGKRKEYRKAEAKSKQRKKRKKIKTADLKAYQAAWRKANRERCRGYEKKRGKRKRTGTRTPEAERARYVSRMKKLHGADWVPRRDSNLSSEEVKARKAARSKKNHATLEGKARHILQGAVLRGSIEPLPCFVCGGKAEGHHPDYSRPRDVVWLCPEHHRQLHKEAALLTV